MRVNLNRQMSNDGQQKAEDDRRALDGVLKVLFSDKYMKEYF